MSFPASDNNGHPPEPPGPGTPRLATAGWATATTRAHVYMSPTIGKLAAALAKAQRAVDAAAKDKKNPHFNSRYADLASVWEACREQLTSNGLAVVQFPGGFGRTCMLTTILTHESGEWISSEAYAETKDGSPQAMGSATTYLRRYALAAVAGVAPDDDDGEAAQGRAMPPKSAPVNHPAVAAAKEAFPEARQVSDEEAQAIRDRELDESTRDEDEQALRAGLVAAFGPNKDDHKPWLFEVAKLPKREPINAFRAKTHAHRQALLDQLKLAELKKDDHVPF
jgi:hypothetical protein